MCVASPVLANASIMDVSEDSPLKALDGSGVVIAVADTGNKNNFHSLHYKAVTKRAFWPFGSRRVFLIQA